jgi:hypothetical protein
MAAARVSGGDHPTADHGCVQLKSGDIAQLAGSAQGTGSQLTGCLMFRGRSEWQPVPIWLASLEGYNPQAWLTFERLRLLEFLPNEGGLR